MDYADTSPAADDAHAPDSYSEDAWLASSEHAARPFYRSDLAFGPDIAPELRADIEFALWLKESVRELTFPVWRLLVYEQAARGTPYADLVILAWPSLRWALTVASIGGIGSDILGRTSRRVHRSDGLYHPRHQLFTSG